MKIAEIPWPVQPGWHLGVTGTRYREDGDITYPTPVSVDLLALFIGAAKAHGATCLHHGACTGWDEAAVRAALEAAPGLTINAHPPTNDAHLSRFALDHSHVQHHPKSYRERNIDIASWADVMAVGAQFDEFDERSLRSGSWMAARFGRRLGATLYRISMHGELSDVTRVVVAGTHSVEAGV